ncbi:xylan glycosyltransferase MUCI21 isoform X2 [Ziziphus jujuba]|nr:xylan glycosyltransferase MUCI21 isoform X2 [Ziziphus jujuba]KAH7516031.1 hypothetical protein FEM48_Zijuj10G0091400 [Ziziphus jujuba var. spinosa]
MMSAPPLQSPPAAQITCNRSNPSYDICMINSPTVLDPTTTTFHVMKPNGPVLLEKVRPYARKSENFTMSNIKEFVLTLGPLGRPCQVQHKAPALVFSAGGYTGYNGNYFHEISDGFIPLYITINTIYNSQDLVLVISESPDWWVHKYKKLLQSLSKHPIITLDNDKRIHCFPYASVGLISHGIMTIDPNLLPNPKSLAHFHAFLAETLSRNHHHDQPSNLAKSRPRLILVGRTGATGRLILNRNEVEEEAKKIGFDVVVFEPMANTSLSVAYEMVSSSHAMVGVHGAGLTHSLFLQPGSVLVQVVPLGNEWVAGACFGKPAMAMGLEYIEYRINANESSLIEKYNRDDKVIKDPVGFIGQKWSAKIMDMYLKEQNVRVDLDRFKGYLKEVYRKSKMVLEKREGWSG